MKKNILTIIVLLVVLGLIGYIGYGYYKKVNEEVKNPKVSMEIEGYGNVEMELYPNYAPNTVKNFIYLIQSGYYDGKVFSGLDSTCLYAGKTSKGETEAAKMSLIDSTIEPESENDKEYSISGEFVANGFEENTLKHEKGVISMCRANYSQLSSGLTTQSYNSANAQFCVLLKDERGLNGMYAAFGKVTSGMDIIENISKAETKTPETTTEQTATEDTATEDTTTEETAETDGTIVEETAEDAEEDAIKEFVNYPVIKSITVETYGVDYGVPEVSEAFDYYNYMYQQYSQQQQ